jgi:hypothetical protein
MRQLLLFILFAVALGLGGCASSPQLGVCAAVSDFMPRREFASPQRHTSLRRKTAFHPRPSHQVAALPKLPKDETPEPRFTSTEWWMRENARLGKAMTICRGCLPVPMASASQPKPAVLSSKSDLQALPTNSIDRFEESISVETQGRP